MKIHRFGHKLRKLLSLCLLGIGAGFGLQSAAADIIFVTQTPTPNDFANVVAVFGNQGGAMDDVPRGGDLYIRYDDGSLKNLTRTAGYGSDGMQGANAIAVRDPAVHWSGTKVLFSMLIGAPTRQYEYLQYYWQLYEITGLGKNETPVITRVANQPQNFNNVMPIYGTDDQIIFSTDRPRNGQRHLYPQRDEYESTKTNTGLWKLNPATGALVLLDHVPSGAFHPLVDSFGRVIYTRWDHMQQDQQADAGGYGAFNFASEASDAARIASIAEVFPEPRAESRRLSATLNLHTINVFFPWQMNEDGTEVETLNHVGRHELARYFDRSFNDDSNLSEFYDAGSTFNHNRSDCFIQIKEDPLSAGTFLGINSLEFGTHASGQIISLNGAPTVTADQMEITMLTHPDTASTSSTPSSNHSGFYRNPLRLSTGGLIAAHTATTREDSNIGTGNAPLSRYAFRLKTLTPSGSYFIPNQNLTAGITRNLQWWTPDVLLTYSGAMWELQPVQLIARSRPSRPSPPLSPIEAGVFQQAGVDVTAFKNYLRQNNLALIVSRDVTTRDEVDLQQPYNLRVTGTQKQTLGAGGKIYDVSHMQIFQGDQIRGYGGTADPQAGRRVIAQVLHEALDKNIPNSGGPAGSVRIGNDGSVAAIVPAQRALSWQITDGAGNGVVRERFWLSFQPGEIRVCTSCHGLNTRDQAGHATPQNPPQALAALLAYWRSLPSTPPSNPPDTSNPVAAPYSVRAIGFDSRKQAHINALFSGRQGAIEIVALTGAGVSQTLSLELSAGGVACPVPKTITTNAQGIARIFGKLSGVSRRSLMLTFNLKQANVNSGASLAILINSSGRPSSAALSTKERQKLCSAFIKFR